LVAEGLLLPGEAGSPPLAAPYSWILSDAGVAELHHLADQLLRALLGFPEE
jgi:hypothetical protein